MDLTIILLFIYIACLFINVAYVTYAIPEWLENWILGLSAPRLFGFCVIVHLLAPIATIFLLAALLIYRSSKKETKP